MFLLLSCYLKLGEWQSSLHDPYQEPDSICTILHYYKCATDYDKNWYKVSTWLYRESLYLWCMYICMYVHADLSVCTCRGQYNDLSQPILWPASVYGSNLVGEIQFTGSQWQSVVILINGQPISILILSSIYDITSICDVYCCISNNIDPHPYTCVYYYIFDLGCFMCQPCSLWIMCLHSSLCALLACIG